MCIHSILFHAPSRLELNHFRLYYSITYFGYTFNTEKGGIGMFEIDKQYANANVARTIRFTEKLFEDLCKTAEENDISFNMLVLQCCRYALDNRGHSDVTATQD